MLKITDRPKLEDVARLAGVGKMTVSRVLNGGSVGPKSVARVHDAMRVLRYRPDQLARSLRTRRTRMLGLIIPSFSDPHFAAIADAFNKVAILNDYAVLSAASEGNPDLELKVIREMLSRRVERIVHAPSAAFSVEPVARELDDVRLMAIDWPFGGARADLVCVDHFAGASNAVKHLILHGHSRIACISEPSSVPTLQERQNGYSATMAEYGLRTSLQSQCVRRDSISLIRKLVEGTDAVSAIFTTNRHATVCILDALGKLRIKIPDDIAIIGFDDLESADLLSVPLSTVRQPAMQMGHAAAERLIKQVQTKPSDAPPQILKFSAELVLRSSCGCSH